MIIKYIVLSLVTVMTKIRIYKFIEQMYSKNDFLRKESISGLIQQPIKNLKIDVIIL